LSFPDRIYTNEEVKETISQIKKGHKHNLRITGSPPFKEKVEQALSLVRVAGYFDFLRTYIRNIIEIDGLTQLHETEAAIWANRYAVENPVDAASLFIQKANHMREYLEGELYYGGLAEKRSTSKRLEFLKVLKEKSTEIEVKEECERLLKSWKDHSIIY